MLNVVINNGAASHDFSAPVDEAAIAEEIQTNIAGVIA